MSLLNGKSFIGLKLLVAVLIFFMSGAWAEQSNEKSGSEPVMLFPIVKDGKWGYIDPTGKVVIEPQYDAAFDFYEGLACVLKHPWRGYIDRTGKMVIEPKFSYAGRFKNGLATVTTCKRLYGGHINYYQSPQGFRFIDRTGKVLKIPCSSIGASEGKVISGRKKQMRIRGLDGKEFKHDAERITQFAEGLAPAYKNKLWGYLDHEMKWAVEPKYHDADGFSEGLASVNISDPPPPQQYYGIALKKWLAVRKTAWGFIDKTGKVVLELKYEDTWRFSEGLASVKTDGKWGYIDKTGAEIIKPQFDYAWPFAEGRARIMIGDKQGFIDKSGKVVVEAKYQPAWNYFKGLARVTLDGKEGYLDMQGKVIWEYSK